MWFIAYMVPHINVPLEHQKRQLPIEGGIRCTHNHGMGTRSLTRLYAEAHSPGSGENTRDLWIRANPQIALSPVNMLQIVKHVHN